MKSVWILYSGIGAFGICALAIGCSGGQHRSVYFAETLAAAFREREQVLVRHRELS